MRFADRLRRRFAHQRAVKAARDLPDDVSASVLVDGVLVPVKGDLDAVLRAGAERAAAARPE